MSDIGLGRMEQMWSKLSAIRDYLPIADLGPGMDQPVSSLPLIGESPQSMSRFALRWWYKIAPHSYILVRDGNFASFSWAASDGAFAYVVTHDIYFDDGATGTPPGEILPEGCGFTWQAVAQFGKQSGEPRFLDYDFYSRRIVKFGRFEFIYRQATPSPDEAPVCIRVVPKVEPSLDQNGVAAHVWI